MHNDQDTTGIPLSAVYRQLDSLPGHDGYDAAAAVTRMMTRWAAEGLTTPGLASPLATAADTEAGTFQQRADLVQHLARRRANSTLTALAAVLAIGGTAAAAAAAASHRAYPILAGIGATAALLTTAVVLIHAITMRAILNDHTRLLARPGSSQQPAAAPTTTEPADGYDPGEYDNENPGVDDDDTGGSDNPSYRPADRGLKRLAARAVLSAVAVAATALAINAGTNAASLTITAAVAGTALLTAITGLALILGSTDRTHRAIDLIRALRNPPPARRSRRRLQQPAHTTEEEHTTTWP